MSSTCRSIGGIKMTEWMMVGIPRRAKLMLEG